MNQQIKQRIEQINNGQVPEGYKKTEFGIFPSDWVTDKKLKDIGSFDKGRGLLGDKMCDSGVPCVGYGDIYMKYNNFHFEKVENFVDEDTASESLPIKKGTLLFTGTGETAKEIGKCVCYNGDETIYAGGDIITFKTNEVNPLFLAYQQYQSYSLAKKASFGQGHSVVHIQKDSLEKLNVAYPESFEEQERIAEILMKWDEAIVLYDRQIEKLKRLKLVCIKKMFPKKRSKVPEVRFKGFTKDWEQRKLGDMMNVTSVKRIHQSDWTDSGVRFLRARDIVAAAKNEEPDDYLYISKEKYEEYSALSGKVGVSDLLVTGVGTIGVPYLVRNLEPLYFKDGNIIWFQNSSKIDGKFLFYSFSAEQIQGFINESAGIGTVGTYTIESGKKTPISLPNKIEQARVGEFFQQLDNLITLHQRKVGKIKTQRKALQQYLLNGIVRVDV